MEFGTITDRTIEENQGSAKKTRILKLEVSEVDDEQFIEQQSSEGEDSNPPDGARAFFIRISDTYQIAIAIDDGIEPDASIEQGEKEIYSSAPTAADAEVLERKTKVRWMKDGSFRINEGTDFATKYNEMKKAFDQLKADHDDFVKAFNLHTQNDSTGAPGGPPLTPAIASTADMSAAKSETVNIP